MFCILAAASWGDLDGGGRAQLAGLLVVELVALAGLSPGRRARNVALLLVSFAAWFGLVGLSGAFLPAVGFLFALCYSRVELRLSLALAAVLAGLEIARVVVYGDGGWGAFLLFGLGYLGSAVFGTWISRVIEQSPRGAGPAHRRDPRHARPGLHQHRDAPPGCVRLPAERPRRRSPTRGQGRGFSP